MTCIVEPKVGDKVNIPRYSDVDPATVIKRTRCYCWVQLDKAELDPSWKPDYIPGGFSVHCTNQREQKWNISRNENGSIEKFYYSKKRKIWLRSYSADSSRCFTPLREGWYKFYDYNF